MSEGGLFGSAPKVAGQIWQGSPRRFVRMVDAAFRCAATRGTHREYLEQVAIGRFSDRLCLAATDGVCLVAHFLEPYDTKTPTRAKFEAVATLSRDEWRLARAVALNVTDAGSGAISVTLSSPVLTINGIDVPCSVDLVHFPPIGKLCCAPGLRELESDEVDPGIFAARVLGRVVDSMRDFGEAFDSSRATVPLHWIRAGLDPLRVSSPYSIALVMGIRDSRDAFGRALWEVPHA